MSPTGVSYGTYQKALEGAEEASDGSRGKKRKTDNGAAAQDAGIIEAGSPIQLAKAVKVRGPLCLRGRDTHEFEAFVEWSSVRLELPSRT